ncbi:MAG: acyl-[acyl-carrier-protein] thioesterase [Alkalispirochaetaceae bacterium]
MRSVWRLPVQVRSYEGDRRGVLKPQALLNYLEEAAQQHATDLGFGYQQLLEASQFWMLARLHVVIDELPGWGESIEVETWPKTVSRLFALRDFLVYRTGDQEERPIIRASSAWLLMDAARGRPLRPEQHLPGGALVENAERSALEEIPRKLPEPERLVSIGEVTARYSDIDVNDHVNNSVYIRWFDDAVRGNSQELEPVELELNFLQEVKHGMRLSIEKADAEYRERGDGASLLLELRDEEKQPLVRGALRYRSE